MGQLAILLNEKQLEEQLLLKALCVPLWCRNKLFISVFHLCFIGLLFYYQIVCWILSLSVLRQNLSKLFVAYMDSKHHQDNVCCKALTEITLVWQLNDHVIFSFMGSRKEINSICVQGGLMVIQNYNPFRKLVNAKFLFLSISYHIIKYYCSLALRRPGYFWK